MERGARDKVMKAPLLNEKESTADMTTAMKTTKDNIAQVILKLMIRRFKDVLQGRKVTDGRRHFALGQTPWTSTCSATLLQ